MFLDKVWLRSWGLPDPHPSPSRILAVRTQGVRSRPSTSASTKGPQPAPPSLLNLKVLESVGSLNRLTCRPPRSGSCVRGGGRSEAGPAPPPTLEPQPPLTTSLQILRNRHSQLVSTAMCWPSKGFPFSFLNWLHFLNMNFPRKMERPGNMPTGQRQAEPPTGMGLALWLAVEPAAARPPPSSSLWAPPLPAGALGLPKTSDF